MTWSDLLKTISRREWKIVALLSLLALVITAAPPIFGYIVGELRGTPWNGMQQLSPGDFSAYLSYIQQAKSGELLSRNMFTVEPTVPTFNVLWWSVGRLAALLHLGNIAAFHVARLLLIPVLAAVTYLTTAFFLPKTKERLLAFAVLFFGSGVGLYLSPIFLPGLEPNSVQWPIDLWVSEANIFASLSYSPHFIASWTLLLLSVLFLALSFANGRLRYGLLAGATACLLFQFHPFHAPTLYTLGLAYWLLLAIRRDKQLWHHARNLFFFVLLSAPPLLYHYVTMNVSQQARAIVAANATVTPWPWHLLFGFGVLSLAAPLGIYLARRGAAPKWWAFLSLWASCHLVLAYAPLVFQRRLLEGLQFPLVMLSIPALLLAARWLRQRLPFSPSSQQFILAVLFVVLFLPTSFRMVAGNIDLYWRNDPPLAFFTPAEAAALEWIADETEDDTAFISGGDSGYKIAGWGHRRVLYGHWVNSGDVEARTAEVLNFFSASTDQQRADFMRQRGIDYIYVGPDERRVGTIEASETFDLVYDQKPIMIFKLR